MKAEDKKRLLDLYDSRYREFGYDVRSVGWGNRESQELRFKILSDLADLKGSSVCDLGCGFGDLYPYLVKRFGNISYCGIDLSKELVDEACRRYSGVNFEVLDILEIKENEMVKYDYVLSSGALSFKVAGHEQHVRDMLSAMFMMSRKGVAVNFLSSYVDYQLDKNFHFRPELALEMAYSLTRKVVLRSDYPLFEFSLYLYH